MRLAPASYNRYLYTHKNQCNECFPHNLLIFLCLFLPLRRTVSPYTLNTVTHIQWRVLNYNGWWNKADINTSSKPVVSYSRWSTSPLLASYSHLYRRFVNTLFSWESFWNTHPKTTGSLFSYIHYHSKVWSWYNSVFFLQRELWGGCLCQMLCCLCLGCRQNSGRPSRASVTKQRQLGLLVRSVHIWRNTDTFTYVYFMFL